MKAYHYTNPHKWESVQLGLDHCLKALLPLRRVVLPSCASGLEAKAYRTNALFCLLEAQPSSWFANKEFPLIWKNLLENIRSFQGDVTLLSFNLTSEDTAYVLDRAHVERYLNKSYINDDVNNFKRTKAYGDYWSSRVSFSEYSGEYCLPELIVLNEIPIKRISVEWSGPKISVLEDMLFKQ